MHGGGRRYGTRLRSVCSWNGQRFFAPAAIVHQSQGPDDPPFAAEVSERRRQEEHARALAVSDPLTGLANYRLLLDRLDSEIKRYQRDGHPFSVLLLDLDGLKKINDENGHLVGSLALCRMQRCCS